MTNTTTWDVLIIGGGLAGLTCALHLSNSPLKVALIERKRYPHHKVCGEYVSNEILPYLNSFGIDPISMGAKAISKFTITNKEGRSLDSDLPLGGFGISRYALDNMLYEAIKDKVTVVFETAESITYSNNEFEINTQEKSIFKAHYVVGGFGKRSNLDNYLGRDFMQESSQWLAVKAHYEYDFPEDTVALHNFDGGYCGLSQVETSAVNACYLVSYKSFKSKGTIEAFQREVMPQNPHLKTFFDKAKPIFDKPLTISQISFDKKSPVEQHIFMIGDSAGLIHPLCGNGMAMAIHSAKIFSELLLEHKGPASINRLELEKEYTRKWQATFTKRLKTGRRIQNLLLRSNTTNIGFSFAKMFPSIVPGLIKKTHGQPIV